MGTLVSSPQGEVRCAGDYRFMSAGRHRELTILRPSSKASDTEMTVVPGWLFVHSAAESLSGKKKIKWQKLAIAFRASA